MTPSGYSGTPLVKKLGFKPGFRYYVKNEPLPYSKLVTSIPESCKRLKRLTINLNCIHFFTTSRSEYERTIPRMRACLISNGMIWVSWPKKSSGVSTDLSEDAIRNYALQHGLVDVKVCAINEIWSGLKLVIPVKLRSK